MSRSLALLSKPKIKSYKLSASYAKKTKYIVYSANQVYFSSCVSDTGDEGRLVMLPSRAIANVTMSV